MTIDDGTAIVLAYVFVSMGVIIAFLLAALVIGWFIGWLRQRRREQSREGEPNGRRSRAGQRRASPFANLAAWLKARGTFAMTWRRAICDCCATACRNLIIGWTSSPQNELALLSRPCAAKRRPGICRPMQVTVRIRVSTARDEQDWQGH